MLTRTVVVRNDGALRMAPCVHARCENEQVARAAVTNASPAHLLVVQTVSLAGFDRPRGRVMGEQWLQELTARPGDIPRATTRLQPIWRARPVYS